MPDIGTHSVDNPEFARVVAVRKLAPAAGLDFDITPTTDELRSIAVLLDAPAVKKLRLHGRLEAAERGAWRLQAMLGATVIQTCVLTLEPVTTRVDTPVHRLFTPDPGPSGPEVVIDGTEDDEIEPLGERIDLGLVAIEALALALPPYPRRDGADLTEFLGTPPGAEPLRDADLKPFAGLRNLRIAPDDPD